MIAVIADDLTGATEIGGIGLRYGLVVEIAMEVNPATKADLLVIATDTRSKTQAEAVTDMERLGKDIASLNPVWVFKKVDSVLRGYVLPEIFAQLQILNLDGALLVPANPSLGRTIENGDYLIEGKPIDQTGFNADPEFPAKHADVLKLLRVEEQAVYVHKHSDSSPEKGVIVGEACSEADLDEWAKQYNKNFLLAGASGFFKAILKATGLSINVSSLLTTKVNFMGTRLYVCGSAFKSSIELVNKAFTDGYPVHYMPQAVIDSPASKHADLDNWCNELCKGIRETGQAILAIKPVEQVLNAAELRKKMAIVVEKIFKSTSIDELIIEGGSTASSILKYLEITTLFPVNEYAPGVIRSKTLGENLHITLKPGSYKWPNEVWTF